MTIGRGWVDPIHTDFVSCIIDVVIGGTGDVVVGGPSDMKLAETDSGVVDNEMLAELEEEVAAGWDINGRVESHIDGVGDVADQCVVAADGYTVGEVDGDLCRDNHYEHCEQYCPHSIIT